jgi:hypothetical protein
MKFKQFQTSSKFPISKFSKFRILNKFIFEQISDLYNYFKFELFQLERFCNRIFFKSNFFKKKINRKKNGEDLLLGG